MIASEVEGPKGRVPVKDLKLKLYLLPASRSATIRGMKTRKKSYAENNINNNNIAILTWKNLRLQEVERKIESMINKKQVCFSIDIMGHWEKKINRVRREEIHSEARREPGA